jgi:hypothetical protein
MFLKLHDIEYSEKRNFILETLRKEFRDVIIEARKVFERFNMLGSRVDVVVQIRKKSKYQYLLNLWECMKLWKRILIGLFLKTLLMKVVSPRVFIEDLLKLIWINTIPC